MDEEVREFVECYLYPLERDDEILSKVNDLTHYQMQGYIWHRQAPSFERREHLARKQVPFYLYSRIEIGECVEDEWAVVWLLLQLSKELKVACTVFDLDGDFMLIEAAEDLPSWINPDNAAHRVFIIDGAVRLIPKSVAVKNILEAINALDKAVFFKQVHGVIESRAQEGRDQKLHRARIILPSKAWNILSRIGGNAVSRSVDALFDSDNDTLFQAQQSNALPPTNLLETTVTFTRTAFAQLACQPFSPMPVSAWTGRLLKSASEELGMKLSCGLEVLLFQNGQLFNDIDGVPPCNDPEDSLLWMEVDLEDELERGQDILNDLKSYMEEGGDLDEDESSDDSEFLENEMLEALKQDPDLLMKLVEKSGIPADSPEYKELFERLKALEIKPASTNPKKGLADLSRETRADLEDYRRKGQKRKEEDDESGEVSSSDDETEIYSESFAEFKSRNGQLDINEYIRKLDEEFELACNLKDS